MKMKKSIPALPVQNIGRAIEFYTTRLGFSVPYHDDGFAKLMRDEVGIHLWAASDESWKNKNAAISARPIVSGAESFLAGTASCRVEADVIATCLQNIKKTKCFIMRQR